MLFLFRAGVLLGLCHVCLAQSSTTSATAVTVTSISTLAIVILPSSNSSTTPLNTRPAVPSNSSMVSTSQPSSIVFPTTPYTGQAILTGTCNIPQYTGLSLQNGAVIEVPLVGCSDDRPECCPSLSPPESSSPTSSPSITGLTATGVISMLSASPLSICPRDFVDIDPVCCPS